jgi:hypothetical protein
MAKPFDIAKETEDMAIDEDEEIKTPANQNNKGHDKRNDKQEKQDEEMK